jgi:ATP-dependent DNA helicase RecQ
MKMQFEIGGKEIIIEAPGSVSVQVRDLPGEAREPAPLVLLPTAAPPAPAPVAVPLLESPANPAVFAALASLRKELAAESGVPPYVVFNDKTLREMAEKMPADLAAFAQISGVGASKLEKYGAKFLQVIQGAAA